jgi:ankyrin repeat protein
MGRSPPRREALYYAVSNNQPEVIKILLDAGADPNAKMGAYSMLGIAAS